MYFVRISSFNPHNNLWSRNSTYCHFAEEETEACGGEDIQLINM